ncbi:MAG: hypothetical protein V7707_03120 [Motiliproteus sp.]
MMRIQTKPFCWVVVVMLFGPLSAQAADATLLQLQGTLQQRDLVILELLERIEALERRVGIESVTKKAIAAKPDSAQVAQQDFAQTDGASQRQRPGAVVVEEGAAERALERSLTRAGALLLPSGILEIEPSIALVRREASTPALITTDAGTFVGETELNGNSLTGNLALRLGLPWDSQLEVGIPYRWRQIETVSSVGFVAVDSASQSGHDFGDLRLGIAKTLLREGLWRPDLVGRVTWDTATGNSLADGVPTGGGFDELQVSLTAIKRQDPVAFVGGLSYEHTYEKDNIQPGSTVALNMGSFIALSPETSLSLALAGSYQDETELAGSKIAGSDRTIGSFIVGGSTLLAPGTLLNLSAGIGLTDDADDFSLSLSLPIRVGDALF